MAGEKRIEGNLAVNEKQYKVITIAPTDQTRTAKLRVAAYARVSTDSSDQINSFSAQTRYFSDLIDREPTWELADIYADEGITGTSAEKRGDFQRLLADCRRGLVDRVLVKSISRFARNTMECLEVVRELKALGIGVFFEKENIDTTSISSEMMTALFASLAQEESINISQNMRWSYQRRMQTGQFITCKSPIGYRLICGKLEIYEPEAKIVREIFDRFLSGHGCNDIAEWLTKLGVPTGDNTPYWQHTGVIYVLRNERYVGNALLQKTFASTSLPFQRHKNVGQRHQYLIESSHQPIVSTSTFLAAQKLLQRRGSIISTNREWSPLSRKIICKHCEKTLRRKRMNQGVFWVCRSHDLHREDCPTLPLDQQYIHACFLRLYFNLKHSSTPILPRLAADLKLIREKKLLWSPDIIELNTQISNLTRQNHTLAELHAQGLVDPDVFISQTNALTKQLRDIKLKKEHLLCADENKAFVQTKALIAILEAGPEMLTEFDAELFDELIDKIIVESNERLRFRLRNGLELAETIERAVR